MVCKKSEYRKQFRKPAWENHIAHFQEKVDYCRYRRYLEHRHTFVPWDWDSSSSNSSNSSDDSRPQTAPNINNNGGGVSKGRKEKHQQQQQPPPDEDRRRQAQQRLAPPEPAKELPKERGRRALGQIQQPSGSQSKPQPVSSGRPRPTTSPPNTRKVPPGKGKTSSEQPPWKPPIAAYGWADSSRDVGSKLTYNVKSSAHPAYVHPSALRTMKHREMLAAERQKEEDRIVRFGKPTSRAVFTVIPPRENVWLTEYQSSFCSPTKPTS